MNVKYLARKFSTNFSHSYCVFRGKGTCKIIKTQSCPRVAKDLVQRSASVQNWVMVSDLRDAVLIFLGEDNPSGWSYLGLSLLRSRQRLHV